MPYLDGADARIFYEQSGAGPDIVWVGGGGARGIDWQRFQTPHFDSAFRSTTFDNRGIGQTSCERPMPWGIGDFARDLAGLVRAVCTPPVTFIGSSLGSAIVQQVAIEYPELVRCAIVMGTGAWSTGWGWDYHRLVVPGWAVLPDGVADRRRDLSLECDRFGGSAFASVYHPSNIFQLCFFFGKTGALSSVCTN